MGNPVFDPEDISNNPGDDEEAIPNDPCGYGGNDYPDTPDTTTISFTPSTDVRLKPNQSPKLLCKHIIDLYRYLDVDPGNVDLVNTDLFKYKESKSEGVVELYFS